MSKKIIGVAIYGCGRFANACRIPNLMAIEEARVVALCDVNRNALEATAKTFEISKTYCSADEMLESEPIEVLYSLVPPFVRSEVETTAASMGIHIFSEKPQATNIQVAMRIDEAIAKAGVLGTVGLRERYNPLFQKVRDFLSDRSLIHVQFRQYSSHLHPDPSTVDSWTWDVQKSGGPALGWGVHATDYIRFVTGADIERIQAFYHQPDSHGIPLSSSFSGRMNNGASLSMIFLQGTNSGSDEEPLFTFHYEGGCLAIRREGGSSWSASVDGEPFDSIDGFDPWMAQDRCFIRAVAENNPDLILNDYHDGLYSLAPILAGWESSKHNGKSISIDEFLRS